MASNYWKGQIVIETIIAITGNKGHGKDTVAEFIREILESDLEVKAKRFAFADTMKEIITKTLKLPLDSVESLKRAEQHGRVISCNVERPMQPLIFSDITMREVLQNFGQGMKDVFGEQVWVKHTVHEIQKDWDKINCAIISDVRFPFEVEFLKEQKIVFCPVRVIKVVRPDEIVEDTHESETEIEKIKEDYLIVNDGNLSTLYNKVYNTIRLIYGV